MFSPVNQWCPIRFFLLGLWMFGAVARLTATLADDLASPAQATRDAAAKALRATYRSTPPADLKVVVDKFHPGMSQDGMLWRLRAFHPQDAVTVTSGFLRNHNYALDGGWLLYCTFERNDDAWTGSTLLFASDSYHAEGRDQLVACYLDQDLAPVTVEPPPHFTGRWVTYYLNGQRSSERRYAHGKLIGETQFDEHGHPVRHRQ